MSFVWGEIARPVLAKRCDLANALKVPSSLVSIPLTLELEVACEDACEDAEDARDNATSSSTF